MRWNNSHRWRHVRWLALLILAGCPASSQGPVREQAPEDEPAIRSAPHVRAAASDWPWWRGGQGNGQAATGVNFDPAQLGEHLRWQTKVPGHGHASPIIWGHQIFVATADEAAQTQSLLCYDRRDGRQLWQTQLHQGPFLKKHAKNSYASATPACDGQHVFCVTMAQKGAQKGLYATAVDLRGKIVWQERLGDYPSKHGYGSSPVLYKSLVIVAGEPRGPGYLVAMERTSGRVVWRKRRFQSDSYGTPVIAQIGGREQLLLTGQKQIISYDPASGRPWWNCSGISAVCANTMVWHHDLVLGSTGYPDNVLMCVRADGSGDVTASHVVWQKNYRMYVPSAVVVDNLFLIVRDDGVALALEPESGKKVWEKRLGGNFSASPTAAGQLVFVPNEEGRLFVLTADAPFRVVATHDLEEALFASPVVCEGQLFLRGEKNLSCFGAPPASTPSPADG